jgi:hypothetical protein
MKSVVIVLLVLVGSPTCSCAQTKAAAGTRPQTDQNEKMPLPEKVAAARTVFLINETEENKFGDKFYQELKK